MSRDRDPRAQQTSGIDRRQQDHSQRASQDRLEQLRQAYRETLSTPAGRMVLWDVLDASGMFEEIGPVDYGRMAHTAGRQALGFRLHQRILEFDLERLYHQMEGEARERLARQLRANVAMRTDAINHDEVLDQTLP